MTITNEVYGGGIFGLNKPVHKNETGGISRTFGGYITDIWGVYHGHLGGISRTKEPLNTAEILAFFGPKLI